MSVYGRGTQTFCSRVHIAKFPKTSGFMDPAFCFVSTEWRSSTVHWEPVSGPNSGPQSLITPGVWGSKSLMHINFITDSHIPLYKIQSDFSRHNSEISESDILFLPA